MINFGLAREVYGVSPWFVDQGTLPSLLSIVDGKTSELPEVKYNSPSLHIFSATKVVNRPYGPSWNPGQLDSLEKFTAVGVININGPITKSGGASSMGMEDLSALMQKMASDERVVSFIILADSGGGSAAAVEIMTDTILEVRKTKPVFGLVKRGGTAASACYGILSVCQEIYAESEMSMVGSAGTMMQFEGRPANSEYEGKKYIRLYASKSTQKNIEVEEALNNDNYQLIIDNILNPVNERFLNLIESNRPALAKTGFDTGKALFAKDAIATYIDGIKSFTEVVEIAIGNVQTITSGDSGHTNPINSVMTVDQLKNDHPATYNAIFSGGVSAEKQRVSAWMAYVDADLDTVKEGVLGDDTVDSKREDLLIKSVSSNHLKNLKEDSAPPVNSPESGGSSEAEEDDELKALNAKIEAQLK